MGKQTYSEPAQRQGRVEFCSNERAYSVKSSLQSISKGQRGCLHIWDVGCAPVAQKSVAASVKMAFLVARISAPKEPCVHPFQKRPLRASVFKSLKNSIWIQTSKTFIFTTGGLPGCKNKKDYSNRVPLSNPCLLRGYTIDRKHSLCNLNPNDVTVRAILCCKNPAVKPKFPTFRSEC